jgi:hypothetical protein
MATLNEDLTPKLLETQHDVIPNAKTVAALFNPVNPTNPVYLDKLQTAAGAFNDPPQGFNAAKRDSASNTAETGEGSMTAGGVNLY